MSQPFLNLLLAAVALYGITIWVGVLVADFWRTILTSIRQDERLAEVRREELEKDEQWQMLIREVERISRHALSPALLGG
jgi:hypothetical protein